MQKKLKHAYHQAKGSKKVRFGLVGAINTTIDFSVYFFMLHVIGLGMIPANIISTGCAMLVSFFLNKKAVFPGNTHKATQQIVIFFGVTLTGIWLVQTGIMYGLYEVLKPMVDMPDAVLQTVVKVIGITIGMIWNYTWYNNVVFHKRPVGRIRIIVNMAEKYWKLVAIGASIVTLIIAMVMGLGKSVWFDEGYSIMLAQRPVSEMIELTRVDAHPPLYYLYLKVWGTLFGWSEFSLRLSSALPGALTVGLMIAILRRLFTTRVALAAAPFLVFAPFLARYNYEIRMYALVCFIGVLATWILLRARESPSNKWWILYAVTVATGMYTLYMSVVIWLAHALWLVYADLKLRQNIFKRKHWWAFAIAGMLFLPWLPVIQQQISNSALPPHVTNLSLEALVNTIMVITSYTAIWQAPPFVIAAVLVMISLLMWLTILIRRQKAKQQWLGIALLAFGFFTAFAFYWYTSMPPNPPRYVERYALHVSVFFYALVGVITYIGWRIGKHWQAALLAVVSLGLMGYGLVSLYTTGNYNFQRLEPVAAKDVRQAYGCNDDTTFVTSGAYGYIDMWYDFNNCDFRYFQPAELTYVGGYAPLNKLNQTVRIKSMSEITADRLVFIYYNDSTEFMTLDDRYELISGKGFGGAKARVYQRVR